MPNVNFIMHMLAIFFQWFYLDFWLETGDFRKFKYEAVLAGTVPAQCVSLSTEYCQIPLTASRTKPRV